MASAASPLGIALVAAPGWRLSGWQAHLVEVLASDPRFRLAGRLQPSVTEAAPRPALPLRAVLAVERRMVERRFGVVDTAAAQRIVDGLPLIEAGADGPDVALALDAGRLDFATRAALPHGEITIRADGHPPGCGFTRMARADRARDLVTVEIVQQGATPPRIILSTRFNPKPTSALTAEFVAEAAAVPLCKALAGLGGATAHVAPAPAAGVPGIAALPGYLGSIGRTVLQRLAAAILHRTGLSQDHWELVTGTGDPDAFEPAKGHPLPRLAFLMADPFLFHHGGRDFLFYEAMDRRDTIARIDVAELEGGTLRPLGTALACDTHLSFPHVFRDGDCVYMIPETQSNRRLEVWRAVDFPLKWELHATAFEGCHAADSFLLRHGGCWWLFTNLSEHRRFQEHSTALHLFSCDGPSLANLRPHPMNPVVIGSDTARNAGAAVRCGGRLFRPAQDNRRNVYGYGLNIMEIEELTPDTYRERLHRRYSPGSLPGWRRLHHATFDKGIFVVDRSPA